MDASFVKGLQSWKNLNAVRLPLNEDCWLGINGVPSDSGGPAYQAAYKKTVELLTRANIAVLADLHWTAPGSTQATGQQQLPDSDHAPTMWAGVAATFKSNPLVIFELFNEPFPACPATVSRLGPCTRTRNGVDHSLTGVTLSLRKGTVRAATAVRHGWRTGG